MDTEDKWSSLYVSREGLRDGGSTSLHSNFVSRGRELNKDRNTNNPPCYLREFCPCTDKFFLQTYLTYYEFDLMWSVVSSLVLGVHMWA